MISAKKLLFTIVLLAVLVRLIYLVEIFPSPFFRHPILDAQYYSEWARKLAWSNFSFIPDQRGNPLYPYFLALFHNLWGLNPVAVRLLQNLLGVLTCLLIFRSGALLSRPVSGLIAAAFYALYAPAFFYEGWLLSAALEAFLLAALLAALLHSRGRREASNWFLDGSLAGLLILARPTLIPLGAILWIASPGGAEARARVVRNLALFIAGAAVVVGAYCIYYRAQTGEWVFVSAHGGENFYIGNNDNANGVSNLPPFSRGSPALMGEDFLREAARRAGKPLLASEASSFWVREGLRFIAAHPLRFLGLFARKVCLFFSGTDFSDNYHFDFFRKEFPLLKFPLDWRLLSALGLLGMALALRNRDLFRLPYLFVVSYLIGIALFFVVSRLRLPIAPVLCLFAGAAVENFIRALKSARGKAAAIAAGGAALYLLLGWPRSGTSPYPFLISAGEVSFRDGKMDEAISFLSAAERELERQPPASPLRFYRLYLALGEARLKRGESAQAGEAFTRLQALPDLPRAEILFEIGNAYAEGGALGEGAVYYRLALEENPGHFRALNNLGLALKAEGRLSEAEEAIRRAIAINPSYAPARGNLGNLCSRKGRWEEAIGEFSEALRLDPSLAHLHLALAFALQNTGRLAEAQVEYHRCPSALRRSLEKGGKQGI